MIMTQLDMRGESEDLTGRVSRRSWSKRAAPRSIATCASWPQACILPFALLRYSQSTASCQFTHSWFRPSKILNDTTRPANDSDRLQPAWWSKCRDFLCYHSKYFSPKESKSATRMHDLIKRRIEAKPSHNSMLELAVLVIARNQNQAALLIMRSTYTTLPISVQCQILSGIWQ